MPLANVDMQDKVKFVLISRREDYEVHICIRNYVLWVKLSLFHLVSKKRQESCVIHALDLFLELSFKGLFYE
jgi:hypothetical protein